MKPGSATRPFLGLRLHCMMPKVIRLKGQLMANLVILDSWPSQARTVYGDRTF